MRRASLALLGLALLLGCSAASAQKLAQDVANATAVAAEQAVAAATAVASQAAATHATLEEQAAAYHAAKISAARDIHAAKVSAAREVHEAVQNATEALVSKTMAKHSRMLGETGAAAAAAVAVDTPVALPTECLSVAEVATKADDFSTLLAAAQAAGLAPALSDRSLQATVFAPTDKAFKDILKALGVTAAELLSKPDLLAAILKYHVVPGAPILSNTMQDDDKLPTLLAADLEAASMGGFVFGKKKDDAEDGVLVLDVKNVYSTKKINPGPRTGRQITVVGSLTEAAVLVADVQAGCPAVVHVIDTVLLPDIIKEPTLWETLATIWATGGAVAEEKAAPSLLV
ncbi:Nex18 symbiotically induced [Micractinium conductrix]|uniref:Nex18 symbiotically induced n=1 Tax=Micractinium conductrix TaxID=554055 RepID=A0A2P6V1H7_9CHLO|nr:Nex18 symbiotically induced [Micractinium conductrix]|eukprot:PSC67952.1 Nex18 symbiotically induced [Micractinium conductrix]